MNLLNPFNRNSPINFLFEAIMPNMTAGAINTTICNTIKLRASLIRLNEKRGISTAGIDSMRYTLNQCFLPHPIASVTPQQLPREITISAIKDAVIRPIPKTYGAKCPATDVRPCERIFGDVKSNELAFIPIADTAIATMINSENSAPTNVSNLTAHTLFLSVPFSAVADT